MYKLVEWKFAAKTLQRIKACGLHILFLPSHSERKRKIHFLINAADPVGPFWILLDTLWTLLDTFGHFWTHLDTFVLYT